MKQGLDAKKLIIGAAIGGMFLLCFVRDISVKDVATEIVAKEVEKKTEEVKAKADSLKMEVEKVKKKFQPFKKLFKKKENH
jgi:hypothetical protein